MTSVGATGVSVDSQGRPVIVFAVCSGRIDAATIYRDRDRTDQKKGSDPHTVDVADWDAIHAITPSTAAHRSLNPAALSSYWRRGGAAEAMRPGVRYTAMGVARDNTYFTGQVEFTLDRLTDVKPGQILSQRYVESADDNADLIQSYDEFKRAACS